MVGALTLLFTDIEGSTRMLDRLGERYVDLLREHDRLLREAIVGCGGREVGTAGDSFFAVFSRADDALRCACRVQRGLAAGVWPGGQAPRVRIGVHTGAPTAVGDGFAGMDVHRAARVMAVAHGGQVLVTDESRRALGESVELHDLGHHRLKDLPAPEHLFQLIASGLEREFPSLRSLNRSNLPTPLNRLVGRREELEDALGLLSRSEVRLLTLTGPGGVGKTRLAIDVAAEAISRYRDGVWIVPLAPIGDRASMLSEIAQVLGVAEVAGQPLERTLVAALRVRELLLVLDNLEHLLDAADLVADLLGTAPGVNVLSTSREPLRLSGEHRIEVAPLEAESARELFLERARAVRADLDVDEQDRAAIERICDQLDGLPLALELAAARIAVFGPRMLEGRLARRLALPAGPRDLPERQRTLRATIDWSYRLLEPPEQGLLASLAPFIGGVRIEMAEQIWGPGILDSLVSLAEKSLVRRREDPDREPRFWMLETIREYALERAIADGAGAEVADRHAEHFFGLTDQAVPHLLGPEQRLWLDRIERDYVNVRAALEYLTKNNPALALKMAGNLTFFWDIRGYLSEARRRLNDALAAGPAADPARGEALFGAGRMALLVGEPKQAEPLLAEALSLARSDGNQRLTVLALSHLGGVADALAEPSIARAQLEDAIAVARAAGDDWALGVALNNCANAYAVRNDLPRARVLYEESLLARRRTGEPRGIATTAANFAESALQEGELALADTLIEESLRHAEAIDFRPLIAIGRLVQAQIALMRDDLQAASAHLRAASDASATNDIETAAEQMSVAATLAAATAQPLRAATLWAAADRARTRINLREPPLVVKLRNRWQSHAQSLAADPQGWESACDAGGQLSIDDALALTAAVVRDIPQANMSIGTSSLR
jgi:predicted ATPase/class 3 adenylate cyclase